MTRLTQPRPTIVFGANGQVGRAILQLQKDAIGLTRTEANLETPSSLPSLLDRLNPSIVINAAAYTAVDLAESERSLAFEVNAVAPGILSKWTSERNVPLIHFSTDYVFSGQGIKPWKEDDPVNPCNVYGQSKLEGEKAIVSTNGPYLIFRTSWIYDSKGRNFLTTILRLSKEKETLRIVNDQIGSPTYAPHLAQEVLTVIQQAQQLKTFPSGIYHLCNEGETSWYGFADQILTEARARNIFTKVQKIEPIPSASYPTPALRPLNSRLDMTKVKSQFGLKTPHWKTGLFECMEVLSK